ASEILQLACVTCENANYPALGQGPGYKAPYKGKTKKIEEEGFKPEDYPGRKGQNPDGHAYFGLGDKGLGVAEDYAGRGPYDGTVVEIKIPRADFDQHFDKFVGSHNGVPRAEVGIPKEMLGLLNSYPLRVMAEL
uniref:hypothetical protein n=1 Tax=Streptomyces tailanensis TaxID=2569858 RepID=UPI001C0F2579